MINQRKAGVMLSYLSIGANSLIQLAYVPMLLYYLTKDQYGLYQLMGSLIAYLAIMDFGLANTTTRYLSQAYAQKDAPRAQAIISVSHSLYLVIAALLVLLGGIFYFLITPIYGHTLSVIDLRTAHHIFLIMLLNIAVTIPANIFTATINAHEHFVFLRGLNFIKTLLQPLLVWGILAWKASVLNLVLAQTGFNFLVIGLNYMYCKHKLNIRFSLNFKAQPLIKELTGFSVFVFLHALMDQIYWRLGQLVLGAVSGAIAVANYAIGLQLSLFAVLLPATISGVFLPQLSALTTQRNNLPAINSIFCKMGRLQFMLMMLLLIGFAFLGKTFITLWVGPGYNICYYIALVLMGAYLIDVSQNIGIPILQAMKKHAFRAYVYVAMAVLNIALCIPLAKRYGETGCACATAICLLIGSGLAMNWYYARVGLNIKLFFSNLLSICKGIIPAVCCCGLLFYAFPLHSHWFSLLWHGSALSGIYALCMWGLALNEYEKNLIGKPLYQIVTKLYARTLNSNESKL